jgi:adenylate cyclase
MTILFSDIEHFTTISEKLSNEQLEKYMQLYLDEMSSQLLAEDATLDKFIGDAIMCFWNAPLDQNDHAVRACRAALRMHAHETTIQPQLRALGVERTHTRIGINTGRVFVGNIGSLQKMNYTVIGDKVNAANRLEAASKIYGSTILISDTTAALVRNQFLLRKIDRLRVRGKSEAIEIFELLAGISDASAAQRALVERYESALHVYSQRNFDQAEKLLVDLSRDFPDDGPAGVLLARVREFKNNPPHEDWDGTYESK